MPITRTIYNANRAKLGAVAAATGAALETPTPFLTTHETNLQLLELAQMRRVVRAQEAAEQAFPGGPTCTAVNPLPPGLPPAALQVIERERIAAHMALHQAGERYRAHLRRVNDAWGAVTGTLLARLGETASV